MARLYQDPMQNPALRSALAAAEENGSITTPPQQDFDTPAMEGSMQQFLSENLGQYVVIEFLVGTQTLTARAGILYAVGTSVVTLYQELSQTFVTCDIFSIKFVTFYLPGRRPWQMANPLFGGGTMNQPSMTPFPGGTGIAPGFAPSIDMTGGMGSGVPGAWEPGQGNMGSQTMPSWG